MLLFLPSAPQTLAPAHLSSVSIVLLSPSHRVAKISLCGSFGFFTLSYAVKQLVFWETSGVSDSLLT